MFTAGGNAGDGLKSTPNSNWVLTGVQQTESGASEKDSNSWRVPSWLFVRSGIRQGIVE